MNAMTKLLEERSVKFLGSMHRKTHFIQLLLALIDVPFALMDRGKISAMRVHETGPQP